MSNSKFYVEREHTTVNFLFSTWTVTPSLQSQLPDCSAALGRLNELKLSRRIWNIWKSFLKRRFPWRCRRGCLSSLLYGEARARLAGKELWQPRCFPGFAQFFALFVLFLKPSWAPIKQSITKLLTGFAVYPFVEKTNQYHTCCFGILQGMICHIMQKGAIVAKTVGLILLRETAVTLIEMSKFYRRPFLWQYALQRVRPVTEGWLLKGSEVTLEQHSSHFIIIIT